MKRHLTETSTGLQIGIAHQRQRQLHTFTRSEEEVQRALLDARRRAGLPSKRLEACVIGLAFVVTVLGSIYFGG